MKRLTIFTPTYNRAYILPKLYESLCVQTCQDFEWLIVDDGSTDNTQELVKEWIEDKKISVRYVYQENRGKMQAFNKAVSLSESELFVCVDSDDQLANEHVVKDSLIFWTEHKNDDLGLGKRIAGVVSLKEITNKSLPLSKIPPFGTISTLGKSIAGETSIITRTDILRHYPYPHFDGEKFITDIYIYDRIDEEYLFLSHPYFTQKCAYQKDGYTVNYRKILFTNPRGHREYHAQRIRLKKENWIKSVICYISMSLFVRDHTLFSETPNLLMTVLLYPLGCMKYLYDRVMLLSVRSD